MLVVWHCILHDLVACCSLFMIIREVNGSFKITWLAAAFQEKALDTTRLFCDNFHRVGGDQFSVQSVAFWEE